MADKPSQDQKTEEPSERKLDEALKDGNTPFSRETVTFGSIIGILVALTFFVPAATERLAQVLKRLIEDPGGWKLAVSHDATSLLDLVLVEAAWAIAPIIIVLLCAGMFSGLVQNTPRLVPKRIQPDPSRLSLAKGWKRLFGQQGFVEFLKSLFKFAAATAATYVTLHAMSWDVWNAMLTHPGKLPDTVLTIVIATISALATASVVLAIADLAWSRYHWYQEQRMTREEVKNEHKQIEGDPLLKSRIRSIARDRARRRMISRVPEATVVIVNPTHYSVALRYDAEVDAAPVVIAKGQDVIALKIREVAKEHGVAVVEDKDLARPLYHAVEVDQIIPHEFFQAVAQIIIYLNKK